ncbi:hypothetical protein P3X46_009370 [Hevea brasiliensis]|uniref:Knottin scorpion toxin-like domain-containing protein n=1 Tax=Hevea brasiliensis TaxID=3981 RepID=A0ABQ9MLM2_HEVBR|nr:hypothetical protein P3X46_009370 [Hevea brasiliensis]
MASFTRFFILVLIFSASSMVLQADDRTICEEVLSRVLCNPEDCKKQCRQRHGGTRWYSNCNADACFCNWICD